MVDRIGGERVGVIGAGYVGLTAAACLAQLGHRVRCTDADTEKVRDLTGGRVGLSEPELDTSVVEQLSTGRLSFSDSLSALSGTDVVMLCLPTPPGDGGAPDLTALHQVVAELRHVLPTDGVLVVKSTVPAGTATRLAELLDRRDVTVVSNPEFLREGHAVHDFLEPDRIVVGTDPPRLPAADRVAELYRTSDVPVLRTGTTTAELAKYASNAFLAVKLSYANVLAELCERFGADVTDVTDVMARDPRIGPAFLSPGPGWGGSCLPKDTAGLAHTADTAGVRFGLLTEALDVDRRRRAATMRAIRVASTGSADGTLAGARIAVLGLAFKPGTDDLRDSPAVDVATTLARLGAEVTAHDPAVTDPPQLPGVRIAGDPVSAAKDASAVAVLTDWPEYRELDWSRIADATRQPVVVDTRNLLDKRSVERAGCHYRGTGVPPT